MIDRYSRQDMKILWSDTSKFAAFLEVEIANCEALNKKGIVSDEELALIRQKAAFSVTRIRELEEETGHDVIAFTRAVSETLGEEKRHIHYGLTSTDVVDTANAILLRQANKIIRKDLDRFMSVLKNKAIQYKNTFIIGRTHGIHADITVFGLKWALWYDEMERNRQRFESAGESVETGKISGAVGNYAFVDPDIEIHILEYLGLRLPNISTQTLQRDRHAEYIFSLALIATTMEKIATEIRHLQRTEIAEVKEHFKATQKGSSAMPHKQNPIASENICGLARIMRSYVMPALEDVPLWHERDISHSSVERIILPDATTLIDYMLDRYQDVLETLEVFPEKMKENINLTGGVIFSQRIMTALIDKGKTREQAYDIIQPLALKSHAEKIPFRPLVKADSTIKDLLSPGEIDELFSLDHYRRHVDTIYNRVFGE